MKKLSIVTGVIDQPGGRKFHESPMPCLGGLGIYLSLLGVVIGSLAWLFVIHRTNMGIKYFPDMVRQIPLIRKVLPQLFALIGGSTVILTIGLVDDKIGVKFDYRLKFLVQIAVAFWMTQVGICLDHLFPWNWLNVLLTILWIVGGTNAFNLLDNLDGLSSGVAFLCCLMFFFVAARQEQIFVAFLFLALSGSVLGFLWYNFNPASIFLGDNGALLVGFLISTLAVVQSFVTSKSNEFPVLMPVIILALPIFDTTRVVLIRLFEGRPVFQGDRRHISHRLVEMGMNPKQAAITVYLMTLALGLGSIAMDVGDRFTNSTIIIQVALTILTISLVMAFVKK